MGCGKEDRHGREDGPEVPGVEQLARYDAATGTTNVDRRIRYEAFGQVLDGQGTSPGAGAIDSRFAFTGRQWDVDGVGQHMVQTFGRDSRPPFVDSFGSTSRSLRMINRRAVFVSGAPGADLALLGVPVSDATVRRVRSEIGQIENPSLRVLATTVSEGASTFAPSTGDE